MDGEKDGHEGSKMSLKKPPQGAFFVGNKEQKTQ